MVVMASIFPPVLPTVGTLSDSYGGLTCSMVVARQRYGSDRVIGCESFENACQSVLGGEIGSFLVPAAYPMLGAFIMHPLLCAVESFVAPIVPLVVAVPKGSSRQHANTLFLHPATEPLLPDVILQYESYAFSLSNPAACQDALSTASCATLTNMPAATHFGMDVIQEVRQAVNMPWVRFCAPKSTAACGQGNVADR